MFRILTSNPYDYELLATLLIGIQKLEYDNFRAMNSDILLAAEGEDAKQGFEVARSYIEASERRFTRFSQTSELAHLNRVRENG